MRLKLTRREKREVEAIGEAIRGYRQASGMSMKALALAVGYRHEISIGRIERGEVYSVDTTTLGRVGRALGVSAIDLVKDVDMPER